MTAESQRNLAWGWAPRDEGGKLENEGAPDAEEIMSGLSDTQGQAVSLF